MRVGYASRNLQKMDDVHEDRLLFINIELAVFYFFLICFFADFQLLLLFQFYLFLWNNIQITLNLTTVLLGILHTGDGHLLMMM
mmetsp:Transcript_36004/g.45845  ORF Transcript_36004/g.45845 Transcript_36004/m.45845 type:complete len:84 (+) Transcript_36004:1187-1438(+)